MNFLEEYKEQFAPNASMHKIISTVDTTKDRDFNVALLVSIKVRVLELKEAISYLKQNFNEKYKNQILIFEVVKNMTKPILLDQMIDFIYKTVPSQCAKCEAGYVPLGQEIGADGAVECIRCRLPAHAECYKAEHFNLQHGVVFVCQPCVTRITAEMMEEEKRKQEAKAAVKKDEEDSDLSPNDTTDEESESDTREGKLRKKRKEDEWQTKKKKIRTKKAVYVTDIDDTTDEEEARKTNKSKSKVCPLLVEGKCPHGAAGRGCKYPHKRKCYYFINYGTIKMHKMGCKYGEDCRQLHPTLCQNSVQMKACYNESCTQAHLRFTKRSQNESSYAKNNDRHNRGAYNDKYKRGASNGGYRRGAYSDRPQQTQNHSQNASSWKPFVEKRQDADSQPQTHSFLEESMKRMEQTLIQKMQEQIEAQFNRMHYDVQYPNYYD